MALASQKIQNSRSGSSVSFHRARRLTAPIVAMLAIGAATVGGVLLMRGYGRETAVESPAAAPVVVVPAFAPALVDARETLAATTTETATEPTEPTAQPNIESRADAVASEGAAPIAEPPAAPKEPAAPAGNGFNGGAATPAPPTPATAPIDPTTPIAKFERAKMLAAGDPVAARKLYSEALLSDGLPPMESAKAAEALSAISRQLVFTPSINANDPCFVAYKVQPGDSLGKIVRQQKLSCDPLFIARLNGMKNPNALAAGKRLKLPKGPISAIVTKRDYRLDLVMFQGDERVVIATMPVGLGAANGTPIGRFQVRPGSKLLDPEWRHPHTGEFFDSKNPLNPIGEHWLGLKGLDESNAGLEGYGIHGTIDPQSIGNDMSLGCIRLVADDVAIVWEALADGAEVVIR